MQFFEYIFYKMMWWNRRVVLDYTPFISSIIILSVFQGFNIIFLIEFIDFYWGFDVLLIEKSFLLPPVLLIVLNYFIFKSKEKQSRIKTRISKFSKKKIIIYNTFLILYFIISLALLIWIGYKIRLQNI